SRYSVTHNQRKALVRESTMKLSISVQESVRKGLSTHELWLQPDGGLIACWERGRELAQEQPELAELAGSDVLVPLPWKGGLEKVVKTKRKYGTMRYLAMWQGLRGEDLNIDT